MPLLPHEGLGPTESEPEDIKPWELAEFDKVVEISNYTLAIYQNGNVTIFLWSPQQPGKGVARLSFDEGSTAHLVKKPGPGWPAEGSVFWALPFSALDAVLRILRDGDPPIQLRVWGSEGEVAVWLSTYSKTRVASDNG